MCNIWKRYRESHDIKNMEMSCAEISDILSNPLFFGLIELDLTGGEPHLREDLFDIVSAIIRLKNENFSRLRSIVITSNGLLPQKIASNYKTILHEIKDANIDLVSVTSIDGIGEVHDKVRGTKGAFELACATIDKLMELKRDYPFFIPGIKTTVLPHNVDMLDEILNFALAKSLFHIISPVFFTKARFMNIDRKDELNMGDAEYHRMLQCYNFQELEWGYYYSMVRGSSARGRKRWKCAALYNYLFIDYDGKIYPCELVSEPFGDLRKQDIEALWKGVSASRLRKKIEKMEICRMCLEPGAIRYSAYAEGLSYLRHVMGMGRKRYADTLYREGFYKYFQRRV